MNTSQDKSNYSIYMEMKKKTICTKLAQNKFVLGIKLYFTQTLKAKLKLQHDLVISNSKGLEFWFWDHVFLFLFIFPPVINWLKFKKRAMTIAILSSILNLLWFQQRKLTSNGSQLNVSNCTACKQTWSLRLWSSKL